MTGDPTRSSRRRAPLGALAALLLACAALLLPASARAGETLDQQQTVETFFWTSVEAPTGQSFTAGMTGKLTRVALKLGRNESPRKLTVGLYDTNGGFPTGSPLAKATVSPTAIPAWPASTWVSVPFSKPAAVAAGHRYAIVMSISRPMRRPSDSYYAWVVADGDPYAPGALVQRGTESDPTAWYDIPDYDGTFQTFVDPAL